jgi:predicted nuclease of predicted toxin-antitoxin system
MRFLTDENIPTSIVNWLIDRGHDASISGAGEPDGHWLKLAEMEERIILSSDKDFGELVFRDD